MEAIAARDQEALGDLYDRYSPTVFALGLRMLGNPTEAEELLVEIMWELWEKADRYNPARAGPRTYIMRLARSRAIDRLRRRSTRAKEVPYADLENGIIQATARGEAQMPHHRLMAGEQQAKLTAALRQLDASQREAIEMAYFDGLSHTQIAERLQAPLGTVKSRIRQGLINLRESLRTIYSEPEPI
jgi:RNA polymerase sigma-70 factor (ECF subfamily)